jgi:Lysyl oxidase
MANLTDVQLYSALCSDVYHHNNDDQWIDLTDFKMGLTPVR